MNRFTSRASARNTSIYLRLLAATAVVAGLTFASFARDEAAEAASSKVTICHRTHATTNPYRRITVANSAVQNARHGGHTIPVGSTNPAVYDSSFSYAANNKNWGDVIPGATNGGSAYNGSASIALNWTTQGQAIFFGGSCGAMTASQFYQAELAAGQTPADIIADLNEQEADEDAALLASIGGSFTAATLKAMVLAVASVSTPPLAVPPLSRTWKVNAA